MTESLQKPHANGSDLTFRIHIYIQIHKKITIYLMKFKVCFSFTW